MGLTEAVAEKARRLGADMVGVAPVERFAGAPLRMSPQGLLPEARSVVVAAIHHLDAAIELDGEPTSQHVGPYVTQSTAMNPMLDDISFLLARFIEEHGFRALPVAASNIWRYKGYKDLKVDFAPDLAHRYAAVAAGLGVIGWNGLALSAEFGPRQRFVSVVTEARLEPSPMYDGPTLCDRCMECVKNCPTDAFRKEVKGINEIQIGGEAFRFPDTNKWRCAWAENFALDLDLEIPATVNEEAVLRSLEKHGQRGGEMGSCLKFCMVPEKRHYDRSYCRAPRRHKETSDDSPEQLLEAIRRICAKHLVDIMGIGGREEFSGDSLVHPHYHLPDADAVICLGIQLPDPAIATPEVGANIRRRLDYAAFDVAHCLDMRGYSAITRTRIVGDLVARALGIHARNVRFETVLTDAHLPSANETRERNRAPLAAEALREFCKEAGADLVGFFNVDRFDELERSLARSGFQPGTREVVEDRGSLYGPHVPEIQERTLTLKDPRDWLPGAQSVIVLGLHFPDAALDIAKTTPAETTGPYSFVAYESLRLLADLGYAVIRRLNDAGHRATMTADLTGLASTVVSPRGMLPDMRSNVFAALLAGLAYPGLHGCPLTREYGVRQRFMAIPTDLPLPNDPPFTGESACRRCSRPCRDACPTSAITGEGLTLELEGQTFNLPRIDCFACDWAKRYALSGQEGPRYCGLDRDIPVPEERSGEAVATALTSADWGAQKRHLSIAEECLRVCPAHRGS